MTLEIAREIEGLEERQATRNGIGFLDAIGFLVAKKRRSRQDVRHTSNMVRTEEAECEVRESTLMGRLHHAQQHVDVRKVRMKVERIPKCDIERFPYEDGGLRTVLLLQYFQLGGSLCVELGGGDLEEEVNVAREGRGQGVDEALHVLQGRSLVNGGWWRSIHGGLKGLGKERNDLIPRQADGNLGELFEDEGGGGAIHIGSKEMVVLVGEGGA